MKKERTDDEVCRNPTCKKQTEEEVDYPSPSLCSLTRTQRILLSAPVPENCPDHFSVHFVSVWLYFQFSNVWILVQPPSFNSKTGAQKHRETKTKRILKGNVRVSSKQQNSEQLKCKCQQTTVRKVARFMKFGCLKISSWIQFLIRTPWDTARDSHLLVFIPEVSTTPIT